MTIIHMANHPKYNDSTEHKQNSPIWPDSNQKAKAIPVANSTASKQHKNVSKNWILKSTTNMLREASL